MFGFVIANMSSLTEEQRKCYRSYYCGLCRSIALNYGYTKRLVLSYDLTFLILVLSSLYDLDEMVRDCRCIAHPLKSHSETITEATQYAAAMNMALAYYNCRDDWHDDKSLHALALSKLLYSCIPNVTEHWPDKLAIISDSLAQLAAMEQNNLEDPDMGARIFGQLLGEIFVWKQDRWSELLRQLGTSLGAFIYLMDAAMDLPLDVKKNRFNPLRSRWSENYQKETYVPILNIMLGECTDALDRLPLVRHADLLKNILYEGVWLRFYHAGHRPRKEENHV